MPSRKNNNIMLPFGSETELKKHLESTLTESLKQLIRVSVNSIVKEEMMSYRTEMQDVLGKVYFNGSYGRDLVAPLGMIKDVPIPRFRTGTPGWEPNSLQVFPEQQDQFMRLISEMHRVGVTQRKVAKIARECFGVKLSANRVGFIHRELAAREEAQINTRSLEDNYQYLYLDGLWVKAKGYGWESNKAVLLCVLGVTPQGKREIVGFTVAHAEDYDSWHDLLLNIKQRGLTGANIELSVSDGAEGLIKALKHLFPSLPHQSCIVHKMRNVMSVTSHTHKAELAQSLKKIYNSEDEKEALLASQAFCKQWYLSEPRAVEILKNNLQATWTYFRFKREDWHKIRTNNILEREFREVRRRINVMDSSFNDTDSASRYAASTFSYLNQNYPASRGGLHTNA